MKHKASDRHFDLCVVFVNSNNDIYFFFFCRRILVSKEKSTLFITRNFIIAQPTTVSSQINVRVYLWDKYKSRIRETLTLSTCADGSNTTIKSQCFFDHKKSCFRCCVSSVFRHLFVFRRLIAFKKLFFFKQLLCLQAIVVPLYSWCSMYSLYIFVFWTFV